MPRSKRIKSGTLPPEQSRFPNDFSREREQMMRAIQHILEEKNFASADEANAFLATLAGKKVTDIIEMAAAPAAREQAQELAWRAMEAECGSEARVLVEKALALDPDCVDALVVLAELNGTSEKEMLAGLERAVAVGERGLGAEFFRENKGYFWGILETRPYMRARLQLAELRRIIGHYAEAIAHYEALLELNLNDNQGVRHLLLGCYLAGDNKFNAAEQLLQQYNQDYGAVFAWGRVLQRFLAGDLMGAARALKTSRRANPYVELYLSCRKRLPEDMPEAYSCGSEEEAVYCCEILMPAWAKHQDAMFWLFDRLYGKGIPISPRSFTHEAEKTGSSRSANHVRRYSDT